MHPQLDGLERGERFMRLLLENQQRIYGLILSLVPNWADADDLMQETTSILWRKFDEFEEGTNFAAWALKVARFQVLNYRKKQRRAKARLSEELYEQIADRALEREPRELVNRREALSGCMEKLKEQDRELIQLRYEPGTSVKDVAEEVDRSIDAVYKALNRIHGQLLECIRLRQKREEMA